MPAKIATPLGEATIDKGVWSADDKALERFLNNVCSPNNMEGYLPNPDADAAQYAVEKIPHAKMISFDKMAYDPDKVY